MKAIIFGITGQDGYYLSQELVDNGIEVIGVSRSSSDLSGSVSDINFVDNLISEHNPDYIFHLAAQSSTNHTFLRDNHDTIATGTINILESVRNNSPKTKVFIAGSALQYHNSGKPIKEGTALAHTSPYVTSRNYSLFVSRYYRDKFKIQVYFGFLFNHDSPRRSDQHLAEKIAEYCRNINSKKNKLVIGDPSMKKEWTFAGDVTNAIWKFVNQNEIFECNIGSGITHSVQEFLVNCFQNIGVDWKKNVEIDQNFSSPFKTLTCNPDAIKSLGWEPKIDLKKLSVMMTNNK